jgi:hypothetical protein
MPKLNKEEFCTAIDVIHDYWEKIDKINDNLDGTLLSGENCFTRIVDNYVDTLCAVMGDTYADNDDDPYLVPWIIYFCWELDFGKNYASGAVEINGKEVSLRTPEDLYNLFCILEKVEEK